MAPAGFRLSPQHPRRWSRQAPAAPWEATCELSLSGKLDRRSLHEALRRAVARHDILRTTFQRVPGISRPVQAIAATGGVSWCEADLRGRTGRVRQAGPAGVTAGGGGGGGVGRGG